MEKGLSSAEVLIRHEKYGYNVLAENKGFIWPRILISQFMSPVVYTLLAVLAISLALGEINDAILASAVMLLDVAMGFYQEYKAEKTFKALKNLVKPMATVIRDSQRIKIDAKELVPGDFVVISNGDRLPADGSVIESVNLLLNEAILTGEQEPVEKSKEKNKKTVFMGTSVVSGQGIFVIEKIGSETKFGKISQSLVEIKEKPTDLQQKLTKFSKTLALIILGFCVVVFLVGLFNGQDIWYTLRLSVILAVAAIPEGLPIAVTIILALGMKRILKRKGLVKRLVSIETLGATTVICTDKTGTLTEGVMKVEKEDFRDQKHALTSIIINNEQKNGMEIALWNFAKFKTKADPYKIIKDTKKTFEIPFDSKLKFHLSVVEINGQETAYLLGAPEVVLDFSNLSEIEKSREIKKAENWAKEGLRVLGIGIKQKGNLRKTTEFEFLGLIGIKDPVRKTVRNSIIMAQEAGIDIKIITGDNRHTAESVASQVGLDIKQDEIIEGWELDKLNSKELQSKVKVIKLFARVSPENKLKIVEALQTNGEIVAMTGDGVNDAPALKMADIGMVVGDASDVAKETADLILLDSNFNTIVDAVEEGRLIFTNIKKVIAYILSNSFVEIILILGAILLGLPTPLTIVQILTIHLVCDGPPDIVLGFDSLKDGLMKLRPEEMKKEEILSTSVKFIVFSVSSVIGLTVLYVFSRLQSDLALAQTIAFASIGCVDLIYIFSFRNLNKSVFHLKNFFTNPYLFISLFYGYAIIFSSVYIPYFNKILGTVPLKFSDWLIVFGIGFLSIIVIELAKLADRMKPFKYIFSKERRSFTENI